MHDAERLVAVGQCFHDNAESENVGQLLEADRFAFHLAPDRIGALATPDHPRLDAAVGEFFGELLFDLRDQQLAALGERVEPRRHHLVSFRIELAERQIVELLAHLMHAHAAGERRVDFQRLFGGAAARFRRHVLKRAHIVQPIGELDQQHAHVVGNRQQQLAEIFRLLGFFGNQIEFFQLGQTLDQRADIVTEQAVDFGAGRLGILDGVVQQRGGDGRVVELEVGEDRRDLDRMRKIRIAGGAPLLAMGLHGVDIGAIEQRLVGVWIVAPHPLDQVVLPHHRRLSRLGRLFNSLRCRGNGRRRGPRIGACFCMRGRSERVRAISAASQPLLIDTTSRYHAVSLQPQGFARLVDK